jgi:hypothetical protein
VCVCIERSIKIYEELLNSQLKRVISNFTKYFFTSDF